MNTKLYVGDLSEATSEDQLRELFSRAGLIKSITRQVNRVTKRVRDYAFVEMATPEGAAKAIELLNGHELDGHAIKVSEARSQDWGAGKVKPSFGGHHGHDQFIRGNNRSGTGRRTGHR